jgi:hypothetical protein
MSITITVPVPHPGELVRLLLPLAEPCLIAAAGLAGLGPIGQLMFAAALRSVKLNAA